MAVAFPGRMKADILILGAGVMGTSIAFQLARRKAGTITIVEKDRVAWGASGRSSALVRMHYTFPPEVQLAVKSLDFFEHWKEFVGTGGDFHKIGFVQIVPEMEIELLKANVVMQQELGVRTRVISREELKEIEPDWDVNGVSAAAYEPDSGYGDGAAVANDFLLAAREIGVDYRPRTRVNAILTEGARVRGVVTDKGEIEAPIVISALGQWTRPLHESIGVKLPIETEYHEVAILRNPLRMKSRGCACIDSILKVYFRSEGVGSTLVGEFYGPRHADPDNYPQGASQESLAEMSQRACLRIPALEDAEVMRGITGVYDMTPDSRPLLGEVPQVSNLYVAAGFSGMGFKLAPAIGLVMAELILDGHATTVDIRAFRPGRFDEGEPIRARFEYQNQ